MKIEKTEFGVSTNIYHYQDWLVLAVTDGAGDVLETYTHGADLSGQVGGGAGGIGGILASTQEGKNAYYHYDFNGNIVQVSDSNQEELAKYTCSPFGKVLVKDGGFDSRDQFSSKEYDVATGLNYYGFRYYSPQLGRWLAKDPIGFRGGLNFYAYCFNNPVNWIDPLGLDTLCYDGSTVTHKDDDGNVVGQYPATSGRPGVTDPSIPDAGPIPEGNYTLNPSEISEGGFLRSLRGDWGRYRAPLHPADGTDTHGRDGFFLHGGKRPGSAGCIDIGSGDKTLFPEIIDHDGPIDVIVDYPDPNPPDSGK